MLGYILVLADVRSKKTGLLHLSICLEHTDHINPPHPNYPLSTVPIQNPVKELEEIFLPTYWRTCLSLYIFSSKKKNLRGKHLIALCLPYENFHWVKERSSDGKGKFQSYLDICSSKDCPAWYAAHKGRFPLFLLYCPLASPTSFTLLHNLSFTKLLNLKTSELLSRQSRKGEGCLNLGFYVESPTD